MSGPVPYKRLTARLFALTACAAFLGCGGPSDPGTRVWMRRCASCHGDDGRGKTRFAEGRPFADLTDDNWKHGSDLESMKRLIAEGDTKSPMPAFRDRISPEEIDAVARYVQSLAAEARSRPASRTR